MAKSALLLKYWPATLFVVSNIAAVTLVVKANSSYDPPTATTAPNPAGSDDSWTLLNDPGFEPLDPATAGQASGDYTPLVFDWGDEFDMDRPPLRSSEGFFAGVGTELASYRDTASRATRLALRQDREADLMRRPVRLNYYNSEGSYLGRQSLLPPVDYKLPPLDAMQPFQFRTGGHDVNVTGGPDNTINVQIDPELFKDPEAMTTFVTDLTQAMVAGGVQPQVQIARAPIRTVRGPGVSPADDTRGPISPSGPPPLPMLPASQRVASRGISVNTPLPKPPSDILRPQAPPTFNPDLGAVNGVESIGDDPVDTTPPPAPAASSTTSKAATPAAPEKPGRFELPGSDEPATAKPTAAPEPKPKPEAKPEPKVNIRIQLARFPDKSAAERAVGRLRELGLGGSLRQDTSSGLDFYVVYTKRFDTRSAADRALGQVRGLGYEAWQS